MAALASEVSKCVPAFGSSRALREHNCDEIGNLAGW
jgi:hypothetical protein